MAVPSSSPPLSGSESIELLGNEASRRREKDLHFTFFGELCQSVRKTMLTFLCLPFPAEVLVGFIACVSAWGVLVRRLRFVFRHESSLCVLFLRIVL